MTVERVDKRERRAALLRAAKEVFASRGYHDAKVDDICSAAAVAKGTYYLYFKDKRAVLEELVDGLFARLGAAILRVDVDRDVRAQVEHNIRAIVAVFLDDPALTRILLSYAAGLDPAFVRKIGSFYETTRGLLRDALKEGQRLGIVEPGDAEFYATVALGALKEVLLEASVSNRARPREEIVRLMFDVLEGGFLRSMPRAKAEGVEGAPAVEEEGPAPARSAAETRPRELTGGSPKKFRASRSPQQPRAPRSGRSPSPCA